MKKINLPITQCFSMSLDTHNITEDQIGEINGKKVVMLGSIDIAECNKKLDVVRDNGAQVVYAATGIEKKLEDILLTYFFGSFAGPNERRDFFVYNVLQSSGLQFSFKKELVNKIVDKYGLLEGERKDKLQRNIKKVMVWRNAFAHGRFTHDNRLGSCLRYYMGSPQVLTLNDEYWSTVEACFKETHEILSEVHNSLSNLHKKEEDAGA